VKDWLRGDDGDPSAAPRSPSAAPAAPPATAKPPSPVLLSADAKAALEARARGRDEAADAPPAPAGVGRRASDEDALLEVESSNAVSRKDGLGVLTTTRNRRIPCAVRGGL